MPRVTHVKAARQDNPVCKKGESYYWWKFRYGGKHYSLTYPRPAQLTQSAYKGNLYNICDTQGNFSIDTSAYEGDFEDRLEQMKADAISQLEEIQSSIQEARDECQESLDNMPEQLQYAPTGELLQERIDALENVDNEIDSASSEIDSVELDLTDCEDDDDRTGVLDGAAEEIQEHFCNIDIDQAVV